MILMRPAIGSPTMSDPDMTHRVERGAEVRLVNLGKRFGNVSAVDRVSLEVSRGEFLTLLGPSGSGKTTTLMMIAGLILPTTGRIFLDNLDVSLLPPNLRHIGVVFQNYALFPHMTVFDNVAFPLRMRAMSKREIATRVEAVLSLVRLEGLGNRYQTQLSGGQQQRVALGRALVFEPSLLLMDEPLGALDKKLREHMQLEIKHLQETLGLTVIYVTHDQHEALTMSNRVAVMNTTDGSSRSDGRTTCTSVPPRSSSPILSAASQTSCRSGRVTGRRGRPRPQHRRANDRGLGADRDERGCGGRRPGTAREGPGRTRPPRSRELLRRCSP